MANTNASTTNTNAMKTLRGAEYDPEKELYSEIDITCLTSQGLQVVRQLSCGGFGCTYKICKLGNCDLVVKIGDVEPQEVELVKWSSDQSIGPRFYGYLECPVINRKSKDEKNMMGVIIMEKLDLNVADLIPWHITSASLELLKQFALKVARARLHHGDLHSKNLMAILDKKENIKSWKLIDFGFASRLPDTSDTPGEPDLALEPIIAEWVCLFDQIIDEVSNSDVYDEDFIEELIENAENIKKSMETELMAMANLDDYNPTCKFYLSG